MMRAWMTFLVGGFAALVSACSADGGDVGLAGGSGGGGGASNGNSSAGSGFTSGTFSGASTGTVLPDGGTLSTPVEVIITSDNAYGFGYGDGASMFNYFGGIENISAEEIFNCPVNFGPEAYTVPATSANAGNYLYIISWADKAVTQGLLAKFSRQGGQPVFTGQGSWEVCATGQDYDLGLGGPGIDEVNTHIGICNAGTGAPGLTSAGWVGATPGPNGSVAFGEDNTTERTVVTPGNEFPIVCEIDPQARWMWYDPDPNDNSSPFIWPGALGNYFREFVIFRLGAEFVPPPPT